MPDRQAVEMLRYHAGWNFALNRQLGDEVFQEIVDRAQRAQRLIRNMPK